VILRQADFESGIYVLLTGIVRVICELGGKGRVTVALLAPGPITEFFSLPFDYLEFRYVACTDCRIGSLSWTDFRRVTEDGFHATLRKFYENNLEQCYRLLRHYSEFLKLGLRQRVALALLDLCSDFGIEDSRGTLLPFFSCKDIAGLVGASRPRVSEHMVRLEQDGIVLRQGHRLIVHVAKLSKYLNPDCR
jgi:CRP-like cAMP-binding protein